MSIIIPTSFEITVSMGHHPLFSLLVFVVLILAFSYCFLLLYIPTEPALLLFDARQHFPCSCPAPVFASRTSVQLFSLSTPVNENINTAGGSPHLNHYNDHSPSQPNISGLVKEATTSDHHLKPFPVSGGLEGGMYTFHLSTNGALIIGI